MKERVRRIVMDHGRLSVASLSDADDLYRAGMTSHSSVNVMLALESEFDIEFPDEMLTRETFATIDAIVGAVGSLAGAA
ncbi:MAG: acyl carrier protein [Thermoleophilia bacterium]|nr:acyl carrier protein [Thermoleophilia bacterium]